MERTPGKSNNRDRRIYLLSVFHFTELFSGKNDCKYKSRGISNRTGIHHSVDSHKHRKDYNEWQLSLIHIFVAEIATTTLRGAMKGKTQNNITGVYNLEKEAKKQIRKKK